jgi:hypothetical protein
MKARQGTQQLALVVLLIGSCLVALAGEGLSGSSQTPVRHIRHHV